MSSIVILYPSISQSTSSSMRWLGNSTHSSKRLPILRDYTGNLRKLEDSHIPMLSPPFTAPESQQPRQFGAPLRQRRARGDARGRLGAEDAGRHHAAQQQRQHRVLGRQDAELPGSR